MQVDNTTLLQQVEEVAKILESWTDQIVIGGGVALILYDTVLAKTNSGAVGTTDIDFLIPRNPVNTAKESISDLLTENGFELVNKSTDNPAVQSFAKEIGNIEFEIEFLTDDKSRKREDVAVIESAGVHAQCLSYIEMSLKESSPLELPNGEKVLVVKPEAWVFHKGLTFPKRINKLKQLKDLYGIWFTLTQLGSFSVAVQKALPKLMKKHPKSWSQTFYANLKNWIDTASPKDWDLLLAQDTSQSLYKGGFLAALKLIGVETEK